MPISVKHLQGTLTKGQAKTANTAQAIAQVVEIGATIGGGVAMLNDAKKAQQFKDYLSNLSDDQQQAFLNAVDRAKSEEDRLAIIAAAFKNISERRIENLSNVIIQQEQINRQKKVEKIILASFLGALVIVFIYLNRKK